MAEAIPERKVEHDEWIACCLPEGGMDEIYPGKCTDSAPRSPPPARRRFIGYVIMWDAILLG